jgi:hypothetical protein
MRAPAGWARRPATHGPAQSFAPRRIERSAPRAESRCDPRASSARPHTRSTRAPEHADPRITLSQVLASVIVLAALLIVLVAVLVVRERRAAAYRATHVATRADVEAARSHSVATSKGSTLGQAAEHLAPVFPEMVERFSPGDWRFLGSPVDFVVFDGLTLGAVERVVFVEVKTGDPHLNARQAQLRDAISTDGIPMGWLTLRLPKHPGAAPRGLRPQVIDLPPDAE